MQVQKGSGLPAPAGSSSKSKKGAKKSVKPNHPKYKEMIAAAVNELKKPRGASRQAISKYINSNYSLSGSSSNHHIRTALKSMVANQSLVLTKGSGAAGSYKINKGADANKTKAKPKKKAASKAGKKRKNTTAKVGAKKAGMKKRVTKAGTKKAAKGKRVLKSKKSKPTVAKRGGKSAKK